MKFSFGWNGSIPNKVAVIFIQDHYIFHTNSWRYQHRDGLISVYITCDGFTIRIDIVGEIGWFYKLFDHIICKNIVIKRGSRQYCRRWCKWWGSRCCGWWVWCRCLIIITTIFLNYCGVWCWCICGIINARWWYLGISEPLIYGFEMTFYCGFGTRWVFSNLLLCDTRKCGEISCINIFDKFLECYQK